MEHHTTEWNTTMADVSAREHSTNRSVERTLHLLLAMEEAGRPMGLSELSRAVQLPKPTVQRLLFVLERYGFAEKWQGRYHLGIAVLPLGHAFLLSKELTRVTLPVLQELAHVSEETASLFVRSGFHRIVVQRIDGRNPLRYILPTGQRLPLHLGGAGKVLAAAMPEKELEKMLENVGEIRLATGELVTHRRFLAELDQVRRQGYAIGCNERLMGAVSVAAPFVDAGNTTIAAVTVAGQADRLTLDRLEQLSVEVRAAAKAIGERYDSSLNRG
jgi:IclR family acetate operon transcriptional repressor